MLKHSFSHITGVSQQTEQSLWEQGCTSWDDYLRDPARFKTGSATTESLIRGVNESQAALAGNDYSYFSKLLGLGESWRAWPEFREKTVYLDIETDGGNTGNAVTLIGLYDSKGFTALVKGDNLEEFSDIISGYSMVVTFFGSGFDIPMLKKRFGAVEFDQIHLDLCHSMKRIGYRGGLKKIEKQLGINRGDDTDGLNGMDAIRLWREHLRGNKSSLEQLIAYNREDVVNLEVLTRVAYDGLSKSVGMPILYEAQGLEQL